MILGNGCTVSRTNLLVRENTRAGGYLYPPPKAREGHRAASDFAQKLFNFGQEPIHIFTQLAVNQTIYLLARL